MTDKNHQKAKERDYYMTVTMPNIDFLGMIVQKKVSFPPNTVHIVSVRASAICASNASLFSEQIEQLKAEIVILQARITALIASADRNNLTLIANLESQIVQKRAQIKTLLLQSKERNGSPIHLTGRFITQQSQFFSISAQCNMIDTGKPFADFSDLWQNVNHIPPNNKYANIVAESVGVISEYQTQIVKVTFHLKLSND